MARPWALLVTGRARKGGEGWTQRVIPKVRIPLVEGRPPRMRAPTDMGGAFQQAKPKYFSPSLGSAVT